LRAIRRPEEDFTHMTTPLRETPLPTPSSAGDPSPVLSSVREIIESAHDLSSWSDELAAQATSWPLSYFLAPARANVLRGLPLPHPGTVLEIGCRAGALTRYLGEESTLVDALEPDPEAAALAALRCADLDTVAVRVGWLDDVPRTPTYDLIVAADVMGDLEARHLTMAQFLTECRARMKPDGLLVLCADNAHGVRHRSGGLPPEPGTASTDRRPAWLTHEQLDAALAEVGLHATKGSAFPDHRLTQVLFDDERLTSIEPGLLTMLPAFPSPAYGSTPVDPALEGALWAAAVTEGRSATSANSLVALIGQGATPSIEAATYWSSGRKSALSASNVVRDEGGTVVVDRRHAFPRTPTTDEPLQLRPHVEPFVRGRSLVSLLAATPDLSRAAELLRTWLAVVETFAADGDVPWDLIPRNLIVADDGTAHPIDQEWRLTGATVDTVARRGAFWLAGDLLGRATRPSWLQGRTHGEAAEFMLRLVGRDDLQDWLSHFVRDEAFATSFVSPLNPPRSREHIERQNGRILSAISQSSPDPEHTRDDVRPEDESSSALQVVVDSLLETNETLRREIEELHRIRRHEALTQRDHAIGITAELEVLRDRVGSAQAAQKLAMVKVRRLREDVADMRGSTTWRIGRLFVAPLARLRGRR
jgi:SAM-dependent methyltransferase